MYRINSSLCWITLYENDRKRLQLFYARRGKTSRDLTYHIKACHGNCMHHPTCVVFKCAVAWKTAPFHERKSLKNTLHIPETIPSRTETRKKMNSKNRRDHIINNTMVFIYCSTYTALLIWSPLQDRTMHNVQSPSLKTSNEEFLTKITYLGDYCIESASWAEQTD